uniref:WD repeat-containing protein 35 n=1 Tax=Setaria digitata TaxID=48799 RepID=A0A915PI34_9BILA
MDWFIPLSKSSDYSNDYRITQRCYIPDDRPRFHVAYKHGIIQLMRNENDSNPVIIRLPNMILSKARWSPDGTMLAICGLQTDSDDGKCLVHFVTAYGKPLRNLQIPGQAIADISWEGDGLRLCAAVDSHLFFANIRPDYKAIIWSGKKWAYCGQTVIYSYERLESKEHCVVFFETKLEEAYLKYVKPIVAIAAYGEHCVLISRVEDQVGQYFMQICNGIGTTVDSKYINLEPKYVAMNDSEVVIANNLSFTVWKYSVPCAVKQKINPSIDNSLSYDSLVEQQLYYVDKNDQIASSDARRRSQCRDSGSANYYSLPDVNLKSSLNLGCRVEKLEFNCSGTRIAVLTGQGLKLFELRNNNAISLNFERNDAWNIKWDAEKDDTIAIMEKTRMYIVKNTETEEPIVSSGYICSFKNLVVRTVLLDELMKNPETPHKSFIIDVEIKSLRNVKSLLQKMKIEEATAFIEKNNHPKLWSLLAEVALERLDTSIAEHAFVMLKDYAGIQLIKRIHSLQNVEFKKAEVAAFYGRIDDAEKIYMENDRRDLALALREKMYDWFRIMEILQTSSQPGDDELLRKAWNHVGDYYAERQKWKQAESYYEKADNHEQLIRCYLMDDNYDNMELLAKRLPDGDKLIMEIGDIFLNAGLCEQAVECFVRCGMLNEALDACIQLNQWERAVELSRTYNLRDVHLLLNRYAEQLTGSNEKTFAAVQLYKRAGKYLEAARIVFDVSYTFIASDERIKQAEPLRLKKLYVMGALLIEQYHQQNKSEIAKESTNKSNAEIALKGLLEEDCKLSLADSALIDNAWRGAEAYHFYMLSNRQFYNGDADKAMITALHLTDYDDLVDPAKVYSLLGDADKAMITALHLTDYDDLVDPAKVYSLLALTSCAARQFAVCSRGFIKLESLDSFTVDEKEAYKKLAIKIFTKYPPVDTHMNMIECPGCYAQIQNYCQICPSCDMKFPTCIVTGRPLHDYQFWLCPTCKHHAYQSEISSLKFCPLCHGNL